jgi:hypothetical protein
MVNANFQELTVLENSLQPFIEHFNENQGKLRFLALLSPT